MMTSHLLRPHTPIPDAGWKQIDEEARTRLSPRLAARRLVDWSGPHGWTHSATNLGQDFSVGYLTHDAEQVTLYLEESFSFRVTEPTPPWFSPADSSQF